MSEYVITNGKIYTEEQTIDKGFVHIKEGKILSVGSGIFKRKKRILMNQFNISMLRDNIFYQDL